MRYRVRLVVFFAGAAVVGTLLLAGVLGIPQPGGDRHPYRDISVPAAVSHRTANVVSSVNFDQRGLDTLGEEAILLASVVGVAVLLRPEPAERRRRAPSGGQDLDSTRLAGYLLLPVTLVIGADTVAHGALTPGGGFRVAWCSAPASTCCTSPDGTAR
jgi:multicomponent Na+:H+ antiporter subunit B